MPVPVSFATALAAGLAAALAMLADTAAAREPASTAPASATAAAVFLPETDALVVDADTLRQAPRIVAAPKAHALLSRGDRAYAHGRMPLTDAQGQPHSFLVFRDATPLQDPDSGEILGYEAHPLGLVRLVRGESAPAEPAQPAGRGATVAITTPATIDVVDARGEIRVGDRLLPEPELEATGAGTRSTPAPAPGASGSPARPLLASVIMIHADAMPNQVVVINRGVRDGVTSGQMLALLNRGARQPGWIDPAPSGIQQPGERNGRAVVVRLFEKVAYARILDAKTSVHLGDQLVPLGQEH